MHQHQMDAEVVRAALDLGEAVRRRRIDAGDELEVEQQITALRLLQQQRLDVLIEPVGRAEEQIALQVQALDLAAMGQQHFLVVARAVQRAAILRSVKAEFDRRDPRRAERKGRAADDDPDQNARHEAPLDDDDDDRQQRGVLGPGQALAQLDNPFVQLVRAQIEQEPAKHEFRHVAEQLGRIRQHQQRDGRDCQAGQPPPAAAAEIQDGAAYRDATAIAAQRSGQDIGKAGDVEFAFQIGFAMSRDLDAGGVEQRARRRNEDHRNQIAEQVRHRGTRDSGQARPRARAA